MAILNKSMMVRSNGFQNNKSMLENNTQQMTLKRAEGSIQEITLSTQQYGGRSNFNLNNMTIVINIDNLSE